MLTFLVLNGCAAAIAALVARAAFGAARRREAWFATVCGAVVVMHTLVLAAGLLGRLSTIAVDVLLTVALAGALAATRRWSVMARRPAEHARGGLATRFCACVALVTSALWARPHVADATRLWIWDDYTYHMVYPALWLREHAIAAVGPAQAFTMQAWYPLSASVVSTWFMLPFAGSRGDALAWVSLTGVLYAAIVTLGFAELLARVGCRPGAWAVPAVLFFTSDRIGVMASSFSDADLAHAAALFAAFVFAIPGDGDAASDTWYAALLTGFAIGVKVSALPAALIVLALTAWRAGGPGARLRAAVRVAAIFAGAWMVTGAYWYLRNVVHTGNPFYPAAFLGSPGTTFPYTTLREYARHWGFARTVGDALVVYLDWPRLHAMVAIAGLVALVAWLLARPARRAGVEPTGSDDGVARARVFFAGGALAITAVTLALLPSTPYSAGNGMTFVSGFIHWDSMRYVALLPLLGWAALGFTLNAGAGAAPWRAAVAIVLTVAALATSSLAPASTDVLAILALGVLLALVASRLRWRRSCRRALLAAVAAACLVAVFFAASHGAKTAATAASFYREPLFGGAAAVLDRQPPGTRVAVFGDQWIYPTFGARHDFVPVRLDRNGQIASTPIGDAMEPGEMTVDPWRFRGNLAASKIDVVAVIHLPHPGRSDAWPSQAAALEAVGGTRLVYRDRAVGLWRLTN